MQVNYLIKFYDLLYRMTPATSMPECVGQTNESSEREPAIETVGTFAAVPETSQCSAAAQVGHNSEILVQKPTGGISESTSDEGSANIFTSATVKRYRKRGKAEAPELSFEPPAKRTRRATGCVQANGQENLPGRSVYRKQSVPPEKSVSQLQASDAPVKKKKCPRRKPNASLKNFEEQRSLPCSQIITKSLNTRRRLAKKQAPKDPNSLEKVGFLEPKMKGFPNFKKKERPVRLENSNASYFAVSEPRSELTVTQKTMTDEVEVGLGPGENSSESASLETVSDEMMRSSGLEEVDSLKPETTPVSEPGRTECIANHEDIDPNALSDAGPSTPGLTGGDGVVSLEEERISEIRSGVLVDPIPQVHTTDHQGLIEIEMSIDGDKEKKQVRFEEHHFPADDLNHQTELYTVSTNIIKAVPNSAISFDIDEETENVIASTLPGSLEKNVQDDRFPNTRAPFFDTAVDRAQPLQPIELLIADDLPRSPEIKAPLSEVPVWAQVWSFLHPCLFSHPISQTRQEICETLEYFRSWEGGVYYSKGVARGYLLDGFPSV